MDRMRTSSALCDRDRRLPRAKGFGSQLLLSFFTMLVPLLVASPAVAAGPVLIELFTTEGCSSCPPADQLLAEINGKTLNGAELIALGEHVDYWNGPGWKDKFSSSQFTDRQNEYVAWMHLKSPYTPQMVIDGHVQVLGNDRPAVGRDLTAAAAAPKPAIVALNWTAENKLHVSAQTPGNSGLKVLLAVTEDGITTSVGGGENKGRVLQHVAVVRQLKTIGKPSHGSFDDTVGVTTHPDWNVAQLKAVVFVQDFHSGEILGALAVPFQGSPAH